MCDDHGQQAVGENEQAAECHPQRGGDGDTDPPLAAAAFGLGHGAQGRVGLAVTGTLGVALGALFVLTNSLLAVVVTHYVIHALELVVHEGLGVGRGGS